MPTSPTARSKHRCYPHAVVSAWTVMLIGCALLMSGCNHFHQHIGPKTILADRLPYNNAVASTWKEQTLLNIVKIRYMETPFFMDVPQIVSGYNLIRNASAGVGLQSAVTPGVPASERILGLFGFGAAFSDRPTIAYSPQSASQFVINFTAPLPPAAVMGLIDAGYAADEVLLLSLRSINGLRNASVETGEFEIADAEFIWMAEVMRRAQLAGALRIRIENRNGKDENAKLRIVEPGDDLELAADLIRLKEVLGLVDNGEPFSVVFGQTPRNSNEIAIKTRPIYLILRDLSPFVNVPARHIAEGRAVGFDTSGVLDPPLMVHCGEKPPEDCFAAAPYRGCWFWIDHSHLPSKRTFGYLQLMLKLADTQPKEAKPTVTIQAN